MSVTPEMRDRVIRSNNGVALFSYGFRPFFFFGSVYAGLVILVWIPAFYGYVELNSALSPLDWHIHELLYGYLAAAVAGFLLTAVPNWTGRLPLRGGPLFGLTALWFAGRLAVTWSGVLGLPVAALIDVSFLLVLALVIAREIIAGKNLRNLRVLVIVALFAGGNAFFLWEVYSQSVADYGIRVGIASVLLLVILIGGRIIPSFTRNWLARENPGRMPVPFGRFDAVTVLASALSLLSWIVLPFQVMTAVLFLVAGCLQTIRIARWAGDRTVRDRLVFILHVGYVFVPIGFLMNAAAGFGLIQTSAGIHAWTAGAFALMTLAVMSRASLGHTGRPLRASGLTQVVYGFALAGAVARIGYAFLSSEMLLLLAGLFWVGAFWGFASLYFKVLWFPKG